MQYMGHFSFEGPEPEFKAESRECGWFTRISSSTALR